MLWIIFVAPTDYNHVSLMTEADTSYEAYLI
jgi:hypothetical protein